MFKVRIVISSFFIFFFATSSCILASEQALMPKYESINPDSLAYPLKRLGEKIKLFVIQDKSSKAKYSVKLLDIRLNEVVYTINEQKTGFYGETINRYNTSVGQIKSHYNQVINKEKITSYIKILEILRDRYPANSAHWLNIQQAIDTSHSIL